MKLELNREQVSDIIEALTKEARYDLVEEILAQAFDDEDIQGDDTSICDHIYAIVDALDDLEEAYNRVSISTGLV